MRGRGNDGTCGTTERRARPESRLLGLRTSPWAGCLTFPTFGTFLTFIRQIAGMPDYPAHLEHLRRCHPGQPVPTQREFYDDFTRARYGDGPTRCC
jgi:uncharacterized short protein YbdD (DUF466 family)